MLAQAEAFRAIALLSAISAFHIIRAQPGYILTLPRTLRAGGDETFCITLHDVDDPVFAFTFQLAHKETQEEHDFEYEITDSFSQCMQFTVPSETGSYNVVLRNESAPIAASGPTEVEVKSQNLITLVQTDKPAYKPGQKVRFRVLTIRRDLMTRTGTIQSIFIKNPNDIRVKQWLNIQSEGMTSFNYPMPAEPTLGEWKIEVTVERETTLHTFKVEEYVLPRFEVSVTPPPYLLSNASSIDGQVCAEYTYGKPVIGYVSLDICLTSYRSTGRPCYAETRKINGCYKFSINSSEVEMANMNYYLYGSKLQITASVREISTGAVVNKTTEEPTVTFEPLKITLEDDTNGFFKPIFPYHGRARVTTPDGKPAPGELIKVTLVDYRNDIRLASNYTTDSNGLLNFSVCDILTEKTQDFSVEARGILYSEPSTYYGLSNNLYMPRAYKTVKQWYSPSNSYISIPRHSRTVPCGQDLEVTIPYSTTPNSYTKFYYQVMSRGRILHTGHKLHHFLKHDSTEFLEVPMATCLQEVPTPSPPPEVEESEGDEDTKVGEGMNPQAEEMYVEEPYHAAAYQPLGVRRRRRSVSGEWGDRREGEEKRGEEELHKVDKEVEGRNGSKEDVHEDVNSDRNVTSAGGFQTHGEHEDKNVTEVHEADNRTNTVHGNNADEHGGSVHGALTDKHGDYINDTDSMNGTENYTVKPQHEPINYSEGSMKYQYADEVTGDETIKYNASDTNYGETSHDLKTGTNIIHKQITNTDLHDNNTNTTGSGLFPRNLSITQDKHGQSESNVAVLRNNHINNKSEMHEAFDHEHNELTLHDANNSTELEMPQEYGNEKVNDTMEVTRAEMVERVVSGQEGKSGEQENQQVLLESDSRNQSHVNSSDQQVLPVSDNRNQSDVNTTDQQAGVAQGDITADESEVYDYDYQDDDYDDDYEEYEDEIVRNQIADDIYGKEPISAAIFEPFGLRRKRSSGIETEMPGMEKTERHGTENEGGEESEEEPPASPPPPPTPSRHVSHFTIRIPVTEEMSPSASLLVYYVREDGETVADSISFNVEACFKNKVKMDFVEKKVVPGGEATLRLQAEPGSVCSVGVVDKSINILGGDHQITPEKMFDILKEYGAGSDKHYHYYSDKEYCERKVIKDEEHQPDHDLYGGWWHYSSRYVDAIVAFRQMGMAVSTNLVMETRPCSKENAVYYDGYMTPVDGAVPGPAGGMPLPLGINYRKSEKKNPSSSALRSYFPETWLWELEKISDSGILEMSKTVPHTITQWVGNTICTSQSAGLGVSAMTSLTTFQPFFLTINLPYAAVRGERLPIHITVFNYLEKCLFMQINLETDESLSVAIRDHLKLPFCLCGGKSKTHSYFITPKDVGKLPVIAKAVIVPGTCDNSVEPDVEYLGLEDSVKRTLFVKAEGVTQEYTKSLYMCPLESGDVQETIDLPLPDSVVQDSARGHVSVIGDIMGPALNNLDSLVQLPTGCGEQTMITFAPNIYVLSYLTMTFQLTEEMKLLTERYMEIGYNRELNYAHDDGSFSAFGKSDASGSTWLTAFVVKSFAQAQRFVYIDQNVLDSSVRFLKSTRMENGCFREEGKVFSTYMMGGLGKVEEDDTALTAFVVVALLEARTPRDDSVLKGALRCLVLQPLDEMDTYTLTLVSYALSLNDPSSPYTDNVMEELSNRLISDGALSYWGRAGSKPDAVNTWHYQTAPSAEIEMTSYGLMATLLYYKEDAIAKAQPIVMWLSQQRNSFGGFSSTQDTVLGLQALSEFASKTFTGNLTDLTVNFSDGMTSQTFKVVTGENTLLLQKSKIKRLPNTVTVTANGTGCALVQASVQYNVLPEDLGIDKPLFNLSVAVRRSRTRRSDCARRSMRICVSFRGQKDFSAGMSMLTVKMVTAWTPVVNSLIQLKSIFPILSMKRYENDVEKGILSFYFDELNNRKRCFEFEVQQERALAVSAPKPAEIQAYQYYERDVTLITSYNIKTTCGTKEEIPLDDRVTDWAPGVPIPWQVRVGGMDAPPLPTQKSPEVGCPVCLQEEPDNFGDLICRSKAIYKAQAGRNGKAPMKIKANLRPRKKTKIDKFASFSLGPECQCDLLYPPRRRLLIVSKSDHSFVKKDSTDNEEVGHVIRLDNTSIIINLDANRQLEKETRRKARRCKPKLL